ncbi:MAG: hypothetical protein IIT98_05320, partial [Kiritimatiellae bacterium]|nr:hypothetical protein [Kiritimatiellia bacterium]
VATNPVVKVERYYPGRPTPTLNITYRYLGTRRVSEYPDGSIEGMSASGTSADALGVVTNSTRIVVETYSDGYFAGTNLVARDAQFRVRYAKNLQAAPIQGRLRWPSDGYVKGGRNTIVAWCDMDNDGAFTPGEPIGFAENVEIGWKGADVEICMTDTSPVITRLALGATTDGGSSSSSSDSGVDNAPATDRRVVWGDEDGDHHDVYSGSDTGGQIERVRVVRTLVNGRSILNLGGSDWNKTVLDTILTLGQRPYIFEADIFSRGGFDIDWDDLYNDVVYQMAGYGEDVTNVTYRIVLGNGTIDPNMTNNLFSVATTRHFDGSSNRQRPIEIAPGAEDALVYGARPTFKWSMEGRDTYTAFKLQITKAGTDTVVWDSGLRRAALRDLDGNYFFTPEAYAGCELEPGAAYSWRVSMYNAKFKRDFWSDSDAQFRMASTLDGAMPVCVKYFGPSKALAASTVKVEAYERPDFSGEPAARAIATNKTSVADAESGAANAWLHGLSRGGTYYIRAWLDMNGSGAKGAADAFEARGWTCLREKDLDDPLVPAPVVFAYDTGARQSVEVFIEDVDSNGNRLPDTWEMADNGGELYDGVAKLDATIAGAIPVAKSLTGDMKELKSAPLAGGLEGIVASMLGTRAGAALALGVSPSRVRASAGGGIAVACEVESVEVAEIGFDGEGGIALAVAGKAKELSAAGSSYYGSVETVPATVSAEVYRIDTLDAEDWGDPVAVAEITVGDGTRTTIPLAGAAGGASGFFKVVVKRQAAE